jgi:hypothetical protein
MPLHLFTGGDAAVKCYYNHQHHKTNAVSYHKNKANINLDELDKIIGRAEKMQRFPTKEILAFVLRDIEVLIDSSLPFDWERLRKILAEYGVDMDTFLSFMHCPAGVCNGEDPGSGTGLFKSSFSNCAKKCKATV